MNLFEIACTELIKAIVKKVLPFLWRKAEPLKWPIAVSFYILYYETRQWLDKKQIIRLSTKKQEQIAMFYAVDLIIDMAEKGKVSVSSFPSFSNQR